MNTQLNLAPVARDLRTRLGTLPKINAHGAEVMDQHRNLRAAAESLGQYLTETYGARITVKPELCRIRMLGIGSSSTGGLHAALWNWTQRVDDMTRGLQ